MNVEIYSDPRKYLADVQPSLEAQESTNNLILGIAIRLVERPDWTASPPFLATVVDESNQILLVSAMTPPFSLLISGDPQLPEAALYPLFEKLQSGGWQVPGVIGEYRLSSQFAQAWQQRMGQSYQVLVRQRIYELRQVIPPPNPPPGTFRPANFDDLETVAHWHFAFQIEAVGPGTLEESRAHALQRIQAGDFFLWDVQGPVSMASRNRPTPHGYTVSSVYTPPEMRGRGYASALVAALSQTLLDSGKQFCNLFTDLSNPTSNSIYQKIGYRPVCDFMHYRFR